MDKFDDTLLEILKDVKSVPNFLDIVFGFLNRRTDFYLVTNDPSLGVGLPSGVAATYVRQAYMKYENTINNINPPNIEPGTSREDNIVSDVQREEIIKRNMSDNKVTAFNGSNGAVYETYSWSQSINDIDIQFKVPENLSAKDLIINTTPTTISIKIRNTNRILLEGDLCQKCKYQETVWSVEGFILQIYLEKLKEMWWDCLIRTEDRLDLNKMDCSRPFHELSETAQVKIEELTWNQERKRQGLPTSDEMKMDKILKQAGIDEISPLSKN